MPLSLQSQDLTLVRATGGRVLVQDWLPAAGSGRANGNPLPSGSD